MNIKKYVLNNVVIVLTGIPNLIITSGTITVATVFFHLFPLWAYLLGQVFSVQYAVLYQGAVKSNFKIGNWHWHFGNEPDPDSGVQ